MAKIQGGKDPGNKGKTVAYELSAIDLRFLKAVDTIIQENKKNKVKPNSDSSVSEKAFGMRTVTGKIRSSQRGVSMQQLQKLAIAFDLDLNYFFRGTDQLRIKPATHLQGTTLSQDKGVLGTGDRSIITQVEGDHNGDIIGEIKGDVFNGSKIDQVIQKAEKIVNNHFDAPGEKEKVAEALEDIRQETDQMQSLIQRKYEDIKKMADIYEAQLLAEREKRMAAERERDEAREDERLTMKKYVRLLEDKK